MSSFRLLRLAGPAPSRMLFSRQHRIARRVVPSVCAAHQSIVTPRPFSHSARRASGAADLHEETFEEFTARYEKEFDQVQDVFELQRNLNNAFAYDLVPAPSVCIAALKAARRVNDYPTAVRIFEGIRVKVESKQQYEEYLEDLKSIREELGVNLSEDLYPNTRFF